MLVQAVIYLVCISITLLVVFREEKDVRVDGGPDRAPFYIKPSGARYVKCKELIQSKKFQEDLEKTSRVFQKYKNNKPE